MAVFMGEDGLLSLGNKTPVTILQEMLQKQGLVPQYDLIYNGTGTLDPVFKYQVTALSFSAIGDGKTKKEAKHDAAAALLRRMQVNRAITESVEVRGTEEEDVASPYTGALKRNFVGALDEVCVINRIPLPRFEEVKEEGPPHARVFTIRCKVGSLTESATARTKKQAKHMASLQMVEAISEVLGDHFTPVPEKTEENEDEEDLKNLKPIEAGNIKPDFSIPVANLHKPFCYKSDENPLPKSFEDLALESEDYFKNLENPKMFLSNLVQELSGVCKVIFMSVEASNRSFLEINKLFSKKCEDSDSEDDCSEEESPEKTNESETLSNSESGNDVKKEECEGNGNKKFDLCDTSYNDEPNTGLVLLQVMCPQGSWVYRCDGETAPDVASRVNCAVLRALLHLRTMSILSAGETLTAGSS